MSNYDRLKNVYKNRPAGILPIKTGMFLEIHENIGEGDTKRVWRFKGLVIKVKKPNHPDGTFTIRGEAARMVVEKIYPLSFPNFAKVLLMDDYKIRRSKLYYIRTKVGKDARFKSVIENAKRGTNLLDLIKLDIDNKEDVVLEESIEKVEESIVEETTIPEKKIEENIDKVEEINNEDDIVSKENSEEDKK